MANEQIPAGWYPDPAGDTTKIRYWDGNGWTDQLQDAQNPELRSDSNAPATPQPLYSPNEQNPYYIDPAVGQSYGGMPMGGMPVEVAPVKDRKGFAVAALVLGIITIPCGCCAYIAFVPGILAVIFGILGLKSSSKGMAIAGLILGGLGILFGLGMTILGADMIANPQNYGLPADFYSNFY